MILATVLAALVALASASSPDQINFDPTTFKTFIDYNFASGCAVDKILTWTCLYCVDPNFKVINAVTDEATQTQFYVGHTGNTIVVAFRGSKSAENWAANLDFAKVSYPEVAGAKVHKGFYTTYTAIKATIFSHIASAAASCTTCNAITVVGHSLGGALGTLTAFDIASAYPNYALALWTTGSPRVGDATFANAFNAKVPNSQRMVANNDEVPHLPTKLMGFTHIATEIWDRTVNGAPTYKVCNGGEDPTCSDSVGGFSWSVADHMNYAGIEKVDC